MSEEDKNTTLAANAEDINLIDFEAEKKSKKEKKENEKKQDRGQEQMTVGELKTLLSKSLLSFHHGSKLLCPVPSIFISRQILASLHLLLPL